VTRVNIVLLLVLVACALSLVTSRHGARRLYVELTRAQEEARRYETEYGQLSLEQSTWSMPARVEKIARDSLHMQLPTPQRVEVADLPGDAALLPMAAPSADRLASASSATTVPATERIH
jgi:cell division protein FtsL